MGYRDHYDLAADKYEDVLRETAPLRSAKSARYTMNVAYYVGGELTEPVSKEHPKYDALVRRTIRDMRIFEGGKVGSVVERPDYHFIFDIKIETTHEPGTFSGLILPFYKACEYTAKLQVLDENGQPFSNYAASAETFQVRHVFLILFTPFYWPGWADSRARRNLFEALSVKLITDRKEFL